MTGIVLDNCSTDMNDSWSETSVINGGVGGGGGGAVVVVEYDAANALVGRNGGVRDVKEEVECGVGSVFSAMQVAWT